MPLRTYVELVDGKAKEGDQNEGEGIMDDSVGKPCDDIKNGVCEAREDANVHAILYRLVCG
jgi:hypothetical protein